MVGGGEWAAKSVREEQEALEKLQGWVGKHSHDHQPGADQ